MAVCEDTDLPLALQLSRRAPTGCCSPALLDAVRGRGFAAYTVPMDKAYDLHPLYAACEP